MGDVTSRRSFIAWLAAGAVTLVACGVDSDAVGDAAAEPSPSLDPTSTSPRSTTSRPTASSTSTSTSTTTTTSTTTSTTTAATTTAAPTPSAPPETLPAEVLPTAAPVPAANADEPIIEVGSIEIAKLFVAKTMYEGVSLKVLDYGPGHWPGTAMPGKNGNMVIAGHRMSHDHPFRDVDLLVQGDEVLIGDGSTTYTYVVTGTEIVTPNAMWILDPTPTATATLFACHPKGSTRERIVVRLELASATA